ncbi:hypothetical protein ACPCSE_30055 [Streptomyces cellulosae]
MPSSQARKRQREQLRAERERLEQKKRAAQQAPAPQARPEPAQADEVNFLLPPDGLMMSGGRTAPFKKTLIVPAPLNAHLQRFQSRHGGDRYKVQSGSLALWRVLLREEQAAVQAALQESARTGLPPEPKWGPVMQAFLAELDLMDREASGDIFEDDV